MLLEMFVIYDSPTDFPGRFVVRPWAAGREGTVYGDAMVAATLEEARELVPAGLHRVTRSPGDDPVIVETWI